MSKRITATLAICVLASVTAGIALARPGSTQETQTVPINQQAASSSTESSAEKPEGNVDHDAMAEMSEASSDYSTGYGVSTDDSDSSASVGADADSGSANNAGDQPAGGDGIVIDSFSFSGTMTVSAGEVVTVTNADGAQHTVTSSDGLFDTGVLGGGGGVGSFTAPTEPGTYSFFCAVHPSMTATLTVVA